MQYRTVFLILAVAEFTKHLRKFIDLDDFWKFCSPLIWAVGSTSVLGYMSVPVRRESWLWSSNLPTTCSKV